MSQSPRARLEGEQIADEVVRSQADAGMSADRIDASAEEVLAARFEGRPTPESVAFWSGYDTTAAIYAADLRDLSREGSEAAQSRYAHGTGPEPRAYRIPREPVSDLGAVPREYMTRVIRGLDVVPERQADREAGQ